MVVRPSRIVAVALVLAMPVAIANCSRILFGVVNAPAHIGRYERHASIAYGASPRQTLDVYVPSAPVQTGARQRPVIVLGRSPTALLIHGTEDYLVHPREAVELERRLRAAGVRVECRIYTGASHFDTVSAFSIPLRFTAPSLADVQAFVDSVITGSGGRAAQSGTQCPALNLRRDWESPLKAGAARGRNTADASAQR